MTGRASFKRIAIVTALTSLALAGAAALPSGLLGARQQTPAPLVRGNAPGEWRYWGGDAWSSRYSALDQINASNFSSLQTAWQ